MTSIIKLKRGLEASIPSLAVGEPGFCTDSKKLFVGASGGNKQIGVDDHRLDQHNNPAADIAMANNKFTGVGAQAEAFSAYDGINKRYSDQTVLACPKNIVRNGSFLDWYDTYVTNSDLFGSETATEWKVWRSGTNFSYSISRITNTSYYAYPYSIQFAFGSGTGLDDFGISQSYRYHESNDNLSGYFIVHVASVSGSPTIRATIYDDSGVAAFSDITSAGWVIAHESQLQSSSTLECRIQISGESGDSVVVDYCSFVITTEDALDSDINYIGASPSEWDLGRKVRTGSYTGNNVNNRTIETGIDFDEAYIILNGDYSNNVTHDVKAYYLLGAYGNMYMINGSPDRMYELHGASADLHFQGKTGTSLYLGTNGSDTSGANYTGRDYRWIAKKYPRG